MKNDDDDRSRRAKPPEDDEDWLYIWTGIDKAHRGWTITGPIYAAVTNWRAWVIMAGILAFIRGDEILMALKTFVGGAP